MKIQEEKMKGVLGRLLLGLFLILIIFQTGCKQTDTFGILDLLEKKWILNSIHYSPENVISSTGDFSIIFENNGMLTMQVDCNGCSGKYTLGDNNSISLQFELCTQAYCGPDSLDSQFHETLENSTRFEIIGNNLRIYFSNTGYLDFTSQ